MKQDSIKKWTFTAQEIKDAVCRQHQIPSDAKIVVNPDGTVSFEIVEETIREPHYINEPYFNYINSFYKKENLFDMYKYPYRKLELPWPYGF